MSSNGLGMSDELMRKFEELKHDRAFRYIICVIKNGSAVVDRTGNRDATYEDMLAHLSLENPAYVIVDLEELIEGYSAHQILLLHWLPEESKMKDRMNYSSGKGHFERALTSNKVICQACDFEEASLMSISEKLLAK